MIDLSILNVTNIQGKDGGFTERDGGMLEALSEFVAISLREKTAHDAANTKQAQLAAIFESSEDYIMLLDSQHRVLVVNNHLPGLPEDVIGMPLHELAAQEDRLRILEKLERVVAEGVAQECTATQVDETGALHYFESMISPVIQDGDVLGSVVVGRDVTKQRRMEVQLAQAEKLSTMGTLAAGVAHEINNPLVYVLYNLEAVTEQLSSLLDGLTAGKTSVDAEQPEAVQATFQALQGLTQQLREAQTGAERIRDITRSLSTFSRVESPKLKQIDVTSAVEDAINMAHNEIKYRARLIKDFEPVPSVVANEGRIAQVVLNLLINASHAIDVGDVANNEIVVKVWSDDQHVMVSVRDTGKGISPSELSRIFEPFFTTKPPGVGSGLGLSICKKILGEVGGDIEVKSVVGQGTEFVVTIPRRPVSPTAASDDRSAEEAVSEHSARGRVLVVDDEAGIRKILIRMLSKAHDVVAASSGREAMELLREDSDFHLIVCDMMMPDMSGIDLHRWLLEHRPGLSKKVLFMTGGVFAQDAQEYLAQAGVLKVEKPFDTKELRKLVGRLVEEFKAMSGDELVPPSKRA